MENQLVVFTLSNEDYGVDIGSVEGIIKMQAITAVPRAPSFVLPAPLALRVEEPQS